MARGGRQLANLLPTPKHERHRHRGDRGAFWRRERRVHGARSKWRARIGEPGRSGAAREVYDEDALVDRLGNTPRSTSVPIRVASSAIVALPGSGSSSRTLDASPPGPMQSSLLAHRPAVTVDHQAPRVIDAPNASSLDTSQSSSPFQVMVTTRGWRRK